MDPASPLFGGMSVDRMIAYLRETYALPEAELEDIRVKGHQAQQLFAEQWPASKEYLK